MAQTAPQFDWESARPLEEEPQTAAAPPAADDTYPGAPLNDPAAQSPGTVSEVMFDWESARPVEARPEFDLESAQPLRELAKDPSYLMSREQFRAYREETKEDNNQVGEFLAGIPGVIPGLYAMGAGTVGEMGQQIAQNWYRPDKLTAALAANVNEGVRRQALFYGKLVDYVGQNLRDSDTRRKREAAYGEQIRLRMQQEGKLSGDPIRDHETVMQALFAAKEAGEIPLTDEQLEEDEERAYQDYWRGKAFDQSMANITDINVAGAPATVPDSRFVGRNMVTGEVVLPGEFSPDVAGMAVDPANILAVGIGSVARVDALRRAGILLGKGLKPTGEALSATGGAITRGADAITERIQLATGGQRVGDKVIGGLSREAQTYGGVAAATAVGYVTGGDTIIDQGMTGALALLPSMRLAGATLRKAGATAGAGWVITNEMAAGPMSAARAETAEKLASGGAIPERYSRFFRNEGRASADSTLRRVAQDQANPSLLRSLAQFGDNVGVTKAVRATDDALSGAIGGAAATAPFALGASDPEMAGNIVGAGIVLGGAGGLVGGKLTRMSQMQDAMVARMLVDSEASGGNAAAFARAYSHGELTYMAGIQAFSRGKLKFVPMTTSEYRVNLDTKKRGGENTAGFHVEAAADGTQKVFINVGEPSAVAGEVVKIRPVTKGGKTIEVRGADGRSTFTYVPNEAKILVKQGDTVAAGDALTRNTSATLSVPEEIGHAIFSSNVMDGLPRDEMRNYINQRYKTEGVAARGREYASRIVDQEIAAGVHGASDNITDATRDRLIEERFTEMSRASLEAGDDALDWARDEIIGATMRAATRGVDLSRLRNQSNFSRLAEQMVASSAQVLRVFGVDVDKMGRVVDPAGTFRDNPVFADPAMRRMVTKYMRDYDQWLAGMEQTGRKDRRGVRVAPSGRAEDLANSPHTVLREVKDANGNGTGVFENDVITRGPDGVVRPKKQADIDRTEVARSAQIKSLWDAGKTVPTASTEFGKRRVNGRDVVGGPTLPPQWDLFTQFPQWIREFARQLEAGRAEGRTWIADYNAIGTGASGRYRVTNLGNIEAILREVGFVGWQITKKNHLLATVFDMNAFRAAAKRAIDNGELGEFGNNMDEVNATLLQYLDNHKNGRPGETGIGQTKKNILNGLIGTGTAKQSAANPFYSDLNPRGSVRTFRVDRLNDLRDTGRTGYNFMYEPINANMMPDTPSALPQAGMAMPDAATGGARGQAMPDVDADYMSAVERGNMKAAQKMVDDAAERSGFNIKAFHGTPEGGFTQFKETDGGLFFSSRESIAQGYTYFRNPWLSPSERGQVYRAQLRMENPLKFDAGGARHNNIPFPGREYKRTVFGNIPEDAVSVEDAAKLAFAAGHDGVIIENVMDGVSMDNKTRSTVYAIKSPDQAKITDPITRDSAGNIIPPSKRFATGRTRGQAMPDAAVTQDGLVQAPEDAPKFKLPRQAMAQFMPDTGVDLADYADRTILALPADRMGIGSMMVGPKGKEREVSVKGQGGAGFMEIYNGGGWAFSDEATGNRFMKRLREAAEPGEGSVLVGITAMSEFNHLKNQTGQLAYVEALEAAIAGKSISKKQADAHIKAISQSIVQSTAKSVTDSTRRKFAAIKNFNDFAKAVRNKSLNFADAAPYSVQIARRALPIPYKEAKDIGIAFDDIGKQTADPRYADVPFGTVVALLKVPLEQAPVRSDFHYSYPFKVTGRSIGFLKKYYDVGQLTSDPRIRNSAGAVQAQPLQTVLPKLDQLPRN